MASAESGWRVVVQIDSGQPELQAALAALPARARAERLRQLALAGLYSLRLGPVPAVNGPQSGNGQDGAVTERRERFLRGLLQDTD
jgi:hypothetical protein